MNTEERAESDRNIEMRRILREAREVLLLAPDIPPDTIARTIALIKTVLGPR